ncbi:MAG TPA: hypothetical protein VGN89_07610 [Phenylobacterium sp.]|nr:hypothetical protein [Phenylobacterium sp.]
MRATVWLTVSALALALAACSPKQPAAPSPPPPPPASEPAPPPTAASAPGPESPPAAPPTPENAAPTGPAAMAAPVAPAAAPPYRFSSGDFPRQERRIAALIANAESRDTSGETQYLAEQGRAQRARCATRPCAEQAYAAEEARLRKWEGSGDIK